MRAFCSGLFGFSYRLKTQLSYRLYVGQTCLESVWFRHVWILLQVVDTICRTIVLQIVYRSNVFELRFAQACLECFADCKYTILQTILQIVHNSSEFGLYI
jgi:hypothetical protein